MNKWRSNTVRSNLGLHFHWESTACGNKQISDPESRAVLKTDHRLQAENDHSYAIGSFWVGGGQRWGFQCRASSDHFPLHSSFLRSSLASFSRLTLHLSVKTPAAVGAEGEGGKGGGGGGRG